MSQTTPGPRHSPESREQEQPPDVPGYLIEAPLGRGVSAEVWSARSCSDGRRVAVKVVALQANSADSRTPGTQPDAAAAELAVLRGIRHPHVLELIDDIRLADGRMAFILELASGGSLARVVRARGYLTVGETVTVVSTLATTLRDVHDSGVTHADLAPGNVLFHLDGRPMLADVGLARVAGVAAHAEGGTPGFVDPAVVAGAPAGPMADIYGLGALGWLCLTGAAPRPALLRRPLAQTHPSVPDELAALLEAALDPDPLRRPSPVELAHGVFQAGPAEPVRLAGDSDPAEQLTHRLRALAAADPRPPAPVCKRPLIERASVPWRSACLSALVALTVGASLVAMRTPAAADRTPVSAATTSAGPTSPSWSKVVGDLSSARAAAFARPSTGPAGFDASGSAAWSADAAALGQLDQDHLSYRGLRLTAVRITVSAAAPRRVSLRVALGTSAYDVVDASGAVLTHQAAGPARSVRLDLVLTAVGWRVARSLAG